MSSRNTAKNWCLTLTPDETKILVLNKAGRHNKHVFKYQNYNLEYVQHCTCRYLGIYFCVDILQLVYTFVHQVFSPLLKVSYIKSSKSIFQTTKKKKK